MNAAGWIFAAFGWPVIVALVWHHHPEAGWVALVIAGFAFAVVLSHLLPRRDAGHQGADGLPSHGAEDAGAGEARHLEREG